MVLFPPQDPDLDPAKGNSKRVLNTGISIRYREGFRKFCREFPFGTSWREFHRV